MQYTLAPDPQETALPLALSCLPDAVQLDHSEPVDNSCCTTTYPTWSEALTLSSPLDQAYQYVLNSGEVLGYSSVTLENRSLEAAVFIGYINWLISQTPDTAGFRCETTLVQLAAGMPFLPLSAIHKQIGYWTLAEDGLNFTVSPLQKGGQKIAVTYRDLNSKLPHHPIDRAIRASDARAYGIEQAATLFYLAAKSVMSGEWIDVVNFRASPSNLPPELAGLIKAKEVKRNRKAKWLIALHDSSKLHRPEVQWFATKRLTIANGR